MIYFRCGCGQVLRVQDDAVGRQAKCTKCGILHVVPATPSAGSAPKPSAPSAAPAAAAANDNADWHESLDALLKAANYQPPTNGEVRTGTLELKPSAGSPFRLNFEMRGGKYRAADKA